LTKMIPANKDYVEPIFSFYRIWCAS